MARSGDTLTWRLRELMRERGIGSASELQRRLAAAGHRITPVHAMRLVSACPQRLSLELLAALMEALDCSPNDLLLPLTPRQDPATPPEPTPEPVEAPEDTGVDPLAAHRTLLGPRLSSLSTGRR